MHRQVTAPRRGWEEKVRAAGCAYPIYESDRGTTEQDWREDRVAIFSASEVDELKSATRTVNDLILRGVETALASSQVLVSLGIPEQTHDLLRASWRKGEKDFVTVLDWTFQDGKPKLLAINGDCPHGLVLGSRAQAGYRLDEATRDGQWNVLEDNLYRAFQIYGFGNRTVTFAAYGEDQAAQNEVELLRQIATRAGVTTAKLNIEDIGYDANNNIFVDLNGRELEIVYLFAPWGEVIESEFAEAWFKPNPPRTVFIEPIWKLLFNQAFVAWLWNQNPDHPNLLPTFLDHDPKADSLGDTYVRKAIWGRFGADTVLTVDGEETCRIAYPDEGAYEGHVLQKYVPLPEGEDGLHLAVSTFIVAAQPSGLVAYESKEQLASYYASVIPHLVRG